MIIRSTGDDLLFVTQPDHAHLAGRVMARAAALRGHPRAASILLATTEHDNGWAEADAAPVVDPASGEPLDFVSAPADVRQSVWPRGIGRLAADPWAAALVAHHAITVYDRYRGDPAWTAFFATIEELRAGMVRASGGDLAEALADYTFVRLGDLLSLMFCTGWTEPQRFGEWTVSRSGDDVTVSPDLFGGAEIPLEVPARTVPRGPYASGEALQDRLRQASMTVLRGMLRVGAGAIDLHGNP